MDQHEVRAWHFLEVPEDGQPARLGNGDGRIVEVGKSLRVNADKLEPCAYGLHACVGILEALGYGKGMLCCRVLLRGQIIQEDHKHCASERRVLAMVDIGTHVQDWMFWVLRTTVACDWPDAPAEITEWAETGIGTYQAREIAHQTYHSEYMNKKEQASLLVRNLARPGQTAVYSAARVARWLIENAGRAVPSAQPTITADIARANLMDRIAPLFDAALLEDK